MDVLECSKEITETDVFMAIELGKMTESYEKIGRIVETGTYKYLFLKRSILINIVDNDTDVTESETSLKAVNTLNVLSFTDEEKFLKVSLAGMLNIFKEEYALQLFNLCIEIGRLEFKLSSYLSLLDSKLDASIASVLNQFMYASISSTLDDSLLNLKESLEKVGIIADFMDGLDINDKEQITSFLNKLKQLIIDTCNSQVLTNV